MFSKLSLMGVIIWFGLSTCTTSPTIDSGTINAVQKDVNSSYFVTEGLSATITEVPCTLTDGTSSTCYSIKAKGVPTEYTPGPWCPHHVTDGADLGGKWFQNNELYDVTGEFVKNLANFYGDPKWNMVNTNGTIKYTNTQTACSLAARPDVDPAYQNHCVECLVSYFTGTTTYLIPKTPKLATSTAGITGMGVVVGLAFNGVRFDPPAPTQAILRAYTIAPMDDGGGHVNLAEGYHYHAATGKTTERKQPDGHAPLIGYAMDGFGLYAQKNEDGNEPTDLDACRGHSDTSRGYHYHVAASGTNSFINCFRGPRGSVSPN